MAKKNRSGRVVSTSPTQRYVLDVPRYMPRLLSPLSYAPVEDRRVFHPAGPVNRPVFSSPRSAARVVARQRPSSPYFPSQTKAILTFDVPNRVSICVKRKVRKQVLHAVNKAGKRGQRKPRRNFWSSISCR